MKGFKKFFKGMWYRFTKSSFVAHISFLWHWKNFFLLLKYPFYRAYNRWSGKFCGYSFTELDSVPRGWRKAFGKQMSEDIKKAGKASRKRLGHLSWRKMITWEQIKEKYGGLRLYASATDEIQKVLDKYEILSEGYCINCGKPARYMTRGWIEFYCEDCFTSHLAAWKHQDDIQEEKKLCRLKKKDLPRRVEYFYNENGKLTKKKTDFKELYGIDFEELWGLKDGNN